MILDTISYAINDPTISGLALVVTVFVAIATWLAIDFLPPCKKAALTPSRQVVLARYISVFILAAVGSAAWDIWWHRAVGRDTFLEPPHIFIYGFAIAAIIAAIYGFYRTRDRHWKLVAFFMTLIPLSAPFDQFWHNLFGVEDISRPVSLAWSPPHLLLAVGALMSIVMLLFIIRKDRNKNLERFFDVLIFATALAIIMFWVLPFHPTEGFGQVLGFYGAGMMTLVLVAVPLLAKEWLHGKAGATRTMIFALIFFSVMFGQETATDVILQPHYRLPNWIFIFSVLAGAIWLDLSTGYKFWLRGAIAGFIMSTIFFVIANKFIGPAFQYSTADTVIAIISGTIGGIVAGQIIPWFKTRRIL